MTKHKNLAAHIAGSRNMVTKRKMSPVTSSQYEALAAFRHALRRFLAFSERNAERIGLTPQQHQALLSIRAGYPGKEMITVGELSRHLLLKHHSTVELVGRLEKAGLVKRKQASHDRRVMFLTITPKAKRLVELLSRDNLDSLRHASPAIADLIGAIKRASR